MTIGPSLPPHLTKRKREEEDDSRETSPPTKIRAASPADAPKRVVGPALPSGDDETTGPAPAPKPSLPAPRRVVGPAPPPAALNERPDDDSSDDDYGPKPVGSDDDVGPTSHPSDAAAPASAHDDAPKPQRDAWMLAPPSGDSWTSRVDPTKLKNRRFASSKHQKSSDQAEVSSVWTETPEERRARLADEVLGRRAGTASDTGPTAAKATAREDEAATARRIEEYNKAHRSKSLVDEFQATKKDDDDDDPTKRAFDREKDMAVGGRLSNMERREMLSKASRFGDRFQKGNYL